AWLKNQWGRTPIDHRPIGGLVLGDIGEYWNGIPAEDHVVDVLRVTSGHVGVPQWDSWQILEEDGLSFLEAFSCLFRGISRVSFADLGVEIWVGVVAIIGTGAGTVQCGEEVTHAWVVSLPAGAEASFDGAVGDFITQGLEIWVWGANSFNAQGVLDGVSSCIYPSLVSTVGVVRDGEFWGGPLIDLIGLCPKILGLFWVKFQDLVARNVLGVAGDNRGGEVMRWGARALEDSVSNLFAVNSVGKCLAAQNAFFATEVLQGLTDGEGLEDCGRLVDCAVAKVRLVYGECGVRDL